MDTIMKVFDDGHEIRRDKRQWIIKHPSTCHQAKRGSSYARFTYFVSPTGFEAELAGCQLKFLQHERQGF